MDDADARDAARLLRAVIDLADNGELDASSPRATALKRRLEGALIAMELGVEAEGEQPE